MKTALVLGVNGILGKQIAQILLKNDYSVLGTSRDVRQSVDPAITLFKLDMSSTNDIDNLVEHVEKNDKIDLFISTIANKPVFNRFELIDQSVFDDDMKINVLNHVYMLKKLFPLINPGGNVIFILSTNVVEKPSKYNASYVTSKYALLGLMKCLAEEYIQKNIRVNALSPGMMDTPFINTFPDMVKKMYIERSKSKSYTDPAAVAQMLITILNDSTLNGENIVVL